MGVNEHGVVIGNEAVFSNTQEPKKEALIGCDNFRLQLLHGA
jgi:secernin